VTTKLITPPTVEPVTLAEAKAHCRVSVSDDDTLIATLIAVARQRAEHQLRRSLCRQTWEVVLDEFGQAIKLPYPPVLTVESVKYIDVDGVQQTLPGTEYALDIDLEPGWVTPAYGKTWPSTLDLPNAVRVRYRAGYSDSTDGPTQQAAVPVAIKHWILMQVGALYEQREAIAAGVSVAELPGRFVDGLLDRYRVMEL
jgi:uncharacterized phiE125 gp8 family phage protein